MSCEQSRTVLHGYLDNELDAARASDFERHLENCRECTAALGVEESLRASLERAGLYDRAPVGLRERIRAQIKSVTRAASNPCFVSARMTAVRLRARYSASGRSCKVQPPQTPK